MALKRVEVKKKVFIMKTEKKIKFSNFNEVFTEDYKLRIRKEGSVF